MLALPHQRNVRQQRLINLKHLPIKKSQRAGANAVIQPVDTGAHLIQQLRLGYLAAGVTDGSFRVLYKVGPDQEPLSGLTLQTFGTHQVKYKTPFGASIYSWVRA
jgi:hypothetical protein